mgnify:CR=1 FL=1
MKDSFQIKALSKIISQRIPTFFKHKNDNENGLKNNKFQNKNVVETNQMVKINSQDFKELIEKFSKENGISKRQARKKFFGKLWIIVRNQII